MIKEFDGKQSLEVDWADECFRENEFYALTPATLKYDKTVQDLVEEFNALPGVRELNAEEAKAESNKLGVAKASDFAKNDARIAGGNQNYGLS